MKSLKIREIPLKNGYKYIGHAKVSVKNGYEDVTPVGPGVVYNEDGFILAEKFDWDGSAHGVYLLANTKHGYREVGCAERNYRHGAVLRTGVNERGIEYGNLSIYNGGQPNGYFLAESGKRARIDYYNNGCLHGRCLLFDGSDLRLGVNTSDGTKKIESSRARAEGVLPEGVFSPMRLGEFSFDGALGCLMDETSREKKDGLGIDVSKSGVTLLGQFTDGRLNGVGVKRTKDGVTLGNFRDGVEVGAYVTFKPGGPANMVCKGADGVSLTVILPDPRGCAAVTVRHGETVISTDFVSAVDFLKDGDRCRLEYDQSSAALETKRLPEAQLNNVIRPFTTEFTDKRAALESTEDMAAFVRKKPKINIDLTKKAEEKPSKKAASEPLDGMSGAEESHPTKKRSAKAHRPERTSAKAHRPEKSRPSRSSSSGGEFRVSAVEIVCTVAMALLVILALSGVTNTLVAAIEKFVFSTYPSYYEFSLMELAEEWLNREIDAFFLLVPIIGLVKIIAALLSFVGQMLLYVLLAIGHVIIFILGMGFNVLIIYVAAPAITIFLIIRAVRNKDVSPLWFILSIVMTILYYLFSMVTLR